MMKVLCLVFALLATSVLSHEDDARKMLRRAKALQPITDEQLRATGDTGYPCVASGELIKACAWYFDFIKQNPKPPKSIAEPYIYGGTDEFHGSDPKLEEVCEKNHYTICE